MCVYICMHICVSVSVFGVCVCVWVCARACIFKTLLVELPASRSSRLRLAEGVKIVPDPLC